MRIKVDVPVVDEPQGIMKIDKRMPDVRYQVIDSQCQHDDGDTDGYSISNGMLLHGCLLSPYVLKIDDCTL